MTDTFPIGKHLRGSVQSNGHVQVWNKRNQFLGEIQWNPRWRCHLFDPAPYSSFTADCLLPLSETLQQMDREKRGNPA